MGPQEHAFRSGVDVIIATPGRLLDHLRFPYARFSGLEVLVLDEADRMLDMGFLPDIRRVLRQLPAKRQTLFFSATMPAPIVALAGELLNRPASVNIERQAAPPVGITQAVYPVAGELKPAFLVHLLERGDARVATGRVDCRHFEASEDGGRLEFEYRLRPGISSQRLGIRVLHEQGVFELLDRVLDPAQTNGSKSPNGGPPGG